MSLPVGPDLENVLASCLETVREVLLPEARSDWARYSGSLCVASLEYAIGMIGEDRNASRRAGLAEAVAALRESVEALGDPRLDAALALESPFEQASALLVAAQDIGGEAGETIRAGLHPVLLGQLDQEFGAAMPLFAAFARNMVGQQ